jgi:protein-S-isoprenylcysteine O-methyltransferase Ste14
VTPATVHPAAEDLARNKRRRAIYVLTAFCASFFVGGIAISYVVAGHYGYGTGFGDGFVDSPPTPKGSGFVVDLAIFSGNIAVDAVVLIFWYWLGSRLEAVGCADDPVAADDGADLTTDENWYYVRIPVLTKSLVAIAVMCIVGVVVLMAATFPVVLIRYGWS